MASAVIIRVDFYTPEYEREFLEKKINSNSMRLIAEHFLEHPYVKDVNWLGFDWQFDLGNSNFGVHNLTVVKHSSIVVANVLFRQESPETFRALPSPQNARFQKVASTLFDQDCLGLVRIFGDRAQEVWRWIQDQYPEQKPAFCSEIYIRLRNNPEIMNYVMSGK